MRTLNIMWSRRQAVQTRRTESGIAVKAQVGAMRVKRDYSLNSEQRHSAALEAFTTKYGWHGEWIGSWLDNNTMVWVNTEAINCRCRECTGE